MAIRKWLIWEIWHSEKPLIHDCFLSYIYNLKKDIIIKEKLLPYFSFKSQFIDANSSGFGQFVPVLTIHGEKSPLNLTKKFYITYIQWILKISTLMLYLPRHKWTKNKTLFYNSTLGIPHSQSSEFLTGRITSFDVV